ncbi:MAG: zinc ribbon domain-containing protein [Chloroflexota bacterium]
MPIYEYWCSECRAAFEKLRPMESNDSEVTCPRCNSRVKRMLSVTAAVSRSTGGSTFASSSGGGCACGGNCGCRAN